ncbi:MAG: DoxX family membrane protein [Alphaproteobacteria bacterium]|nr:DoxX family membrane protein [Alphaproteobacteria bacterium]
MMPAPTRGALDTAAGDRPTAIDEPLWRNAAIALLSVRVIQGFIYWGGGSRRFIYAPQKLDPDAHTWMANKFQSAMPGALLGTDHLIAYLLQHFWLLYPAIILFSAAELIAGIALIAGLMTRLAALATIGFSIVLQLMFGWQGGTCIDEWTMAACNLAIGATLLLAGSGAYSADNALLRRHPGLAAHAWFRWAAGSLPLPLAATAYRNLGLVLLALVVAFNVGTYSYLRGSVVTRYHAGRVSPTMHHFTLSDGRLLRDGAVRFDIYLDGGTPDIPAHIMKAELLAADGQPIETWSSEALSRLPAQAIRNDFDYNKFGVGPYGIVAQMGARATITLPPASDFAAGAARGVTFRLTDVDDGRFSVKLAEGQ